MQRKIYQELLKWKNSKNFNILMIMGVRQCGKTYIINKFCKNEYKNYKKIDLYTDKEIVDLYKSDLNSDEKFNQLQLLIDYDLNQKDSILFIDEIQESEELISELKYFHEKHSNIRIICAGSLLEVKLMDLKKPFPVGMITRLQMYPMDFEEFLNAHNEQNLMKEIKKCFEENKAIGKLLNEKCLNYYRRYLLSGGMPRSVQNMVQCQNNYINFDRSILNDIIEDYKNDMNNHVSSRIETLKINKIYDTLPSQLLNASKKFQYSNIEAKAKSRDYILPLDWLEASNMVQICNCAKKAEKPLKGFLDEDTFKIYYSDVGILNQIVGNSIRSIILDENGLYKGIITENYVANQLKSNGIDLIYWKGPRNSEVDFLIDTKDGIIPIEVKANTNTQSKSLKVYYDIYKPNYMIRISAKDFGYNPETKIKSIPLYATYLLKELQEK